MGKDDMDEERLFEDIIRGQEMRDEGIISHDAHLRELEVETRVQYIDAGFKAIPTDDLEALEDRAGSLWSHYDKIATVSGRLEIVSSEDIDIISGYLGTIAMTDSDGEAIHTMPSDEDMFFINVDAAKLRSGGPMIDTVYDNDGRLEDVRVGYQFYLLDDTEEEMPLFARPDNLIRHEYDIPTPIEARARLERRWPQQLEAINSILAMPEALQHRLALLVASIEVELKDDTFRNLAELYVNDELALDIRTPHMALIRGSLNVLEDIESDDSSWKKLEVEGGLTLFLYDLKVSFSSVLADIEDSPGAYLLGTTFNDEYGDKPEVVEVPVSNIERFLSTRASTSLAERALAAMDRDIDEQLQTIVALKNEVKFAEAEQEEDATPEYIRQLEVLEEVIHRTQKISDEYRTHMFVTPDDAKHDADKLLEKVMEHFNGTVFSSGGHVIEAMGENIMVPNLRYNMEWDENEALFKHGVHKEDPVRGVALGDIVLGRSVQLHAIVESTAASEDDDTTLFYTPRIVMAIITSEAVGMSVGSEPELSRLFVRHQASVPLDSSSDIRLATLDQYRESREALQQAQNVYGDASPLTSRILQLDEAFNSESISDFKSLDATMISRFGVDLQREVRRHHRPITPAANALEAMLGDRNVLMASDVYSRTQEGRFKLDAERSGMIHGWRVIDIKPHQDGDEILMFVHSPKDEQYRYIPMSSVTEFRF